MWILVPRPHIFFSRDTVQRSEVRACDCLRHCSTPHQRLLFSWWTQSFRFLTNWSDRPIAGLGLSGLSLFLCTPAYPPLRCLSRISRYPYLVWTIKPLQLVWAIQDQSRCDSVSPDGSLAVRAHRHCSTKPDSTATCASRQHYAHNLGRNIVP